MTDELRSTYEVVVVGGGPAGLKAFHGVFAREGTPSAELLERGRAEVRSYGGHVVAAKVGNAARDGDGFVVTLADGRAVHARRLLITSGLVDELPHIPGLRERWGNDVLHCPYCHGWEVRDRAVGVIATDRWPCIRPCCSGT